MLDNIVLALIVLGLGYLIYKSFPFDPPLGRA